MSAGVFHIPNTFTVIIMVINVVFIEEIAYIRKRQDYHQLKLTWEELLLACILVRVGRTDILY